MKVFYFKMVFFLFFQKNMVVLIKTDITNTDHNTDPESRCHFLVILTR